MIVLPNIWSQNTDTAPVKVMVCNNHLHSLVLYWKMEGLKLEVNEEANLVVLHFLNRMKSNKLWSENSKPLTPHLLYSRLLFIETCHKTCNSIKFLFIKPQTQLKSKSYISPHRHDKPKSPIPRFIVSCTLFNSVDSFNFYYYLYFNSTTIQTSPGVLQLSGLPLRPKIK